VPLKIILFDKFFLLILASSLCVRLISIAFFGMQDMPDSSGYWEYADYILATPDWGDKNAYLFRMVGYPYLIAALKSLSSDHWRILLGALQVMLSLTATSFLFVAAVRLLENIKIARLIAIIYIFSIFFFLDTTVLTDSLSSHLFTIIFSILVITFCHERPKIIFPFLICGLLLAGCFMLREGTTYLVVASFPLIGLLIYKISCIYSLRWGVLALLLYFLPLVTAHQSILSWNEARTGERFVTTGARTVYTYALMKPYLTYFPEIFSGDSELDQAFRTYVKTDSFMDIILLNEHLQNDLKWSETKIIEKSKEKYFETLRSNPKVIAFIIASNIKPNTFFSLFQPTLSIGQKISVAEDHYKYWRARFIVFDFLKTFNFKLIFPILLLVIESIIGVFIFSLFVFVLPIHIFKKLKNEPFRNFINSNEALLFCLALLYIGFWLIHALVHLEARYHAGVNMVVLLSSAFLLKEYPNMLPRKIRQLLH
jgi:hypothetical protein